MHQNINKINNIQTQYKYHYQAILLKQKLFTDQSQLINQLTETISMHRNQKLRLIQQISFMLRLSQPAIGTVLHFYRKFNQAQQQSKIQSNYSNEVIVCACIFLTAKIFEDERKIRDILNAIYSAIKVYQLAKAKQNQSQKQSNYIGLGVVLETASVQSIMHSMQPSYDLATYSQLKKQVLEAEEQLLKIIKFDFSFAQTKSNNFKQLLAVCDRLRLSRSVIQNAVNVYNDLELSQDIVIWVPGIVYFAVEVAAVQSELNATVNTNIVNANAHINVNIKQQNHQDQHEQQSGQIKNKEEIDNRIIEQTEQLNEPLPLNKQSSVKQQQTNHILSNKEQVVVQWQRLFLVPVKKLQAYSEKIVGYYETLTQEQHSQQSQ